MDKEQDARELGEIQARLSAVEDEVLTLRKRSHKHAGYIVRFVGINGRVTEVELRVKSLEGWKGKWAWIIGSIAGAAAIIGGAITFILDRVAR